MSVPEFGQEAAGMEFELGQTYAGYEILQLIRSSRSAHEYRVRNVFAQREETLKVLPSASQDNREIADAFLREARILARVSHPNIVTFFNAQPIDGRMVMTTEFIGVEPLSARLRSGVMPWREALDAADQLLAALASLHEANVIHLDITPESVVCQSGVWKLVNFEKARVVNGVPLTGNGAVSGNVKYISPEQVKGGTIDRRSDIYSLGTVIYEMLCGRTPFDSNSQFELMLAHVSATPAPPSQFCKDLPGGVDDVVLSALAKEPASRPDARQFAAELKRIAETATIVLASQPPIAVEDAVPEAVVLETAVPESIQLHSLVSMEPEAQPTVHAWSSTGVESGAPEPVEIQSAVAVAELLPQQAVSEPAIPEATEAQHAAAETPEIVAFHSPVAGEQAHPGHVAVDLEAAEPIQVHSAVAVEEAVPAPVAVEASEVVTFHSPIAVEEAPPGQVAMEPEIAEPIQVHSAVAVEEASPEPVAVQASEVATFHSPVAVEEAHSGHVAMEPEIAEPIQVHSAVAVEEAVPAPVAVEASEVVTFHSPVADEEAHPGHVAMEPEIAEPIQVHSAVAVEEAVSAPVAVEASEVVTFHSPVADEEALPVHVALEPEAPEPIQAQPAVAFDQALRNIVPFEPEVTEYIDAPSDLAVDEALPAPVAVGPEAVESLETYSAVPVEEEVIPQHVAFDTEAAEPIEALSAASVEEVLPAHAAMEPEADEPIPAQLAVPVEEVLPGHAIFEAETPERIEVRPVVAVEEVSHQHVTFPAEAAEASTAQNLVSVEQSSATVEEPVPAHVALTDVVADAAPPTPGAVPTDVAGLAALAVAVTQMVRESEALAPVTEAQSTTDALPETVEYQSDFPAVAESEHEPIVVEPMLFDAIETEPAPPGVINAVAELMPNAVEFRPSASAAVQAIESVPALLGPAGVEPAVTNQPLAEVVSEALAPHAPVGPDPALQANLWAAAAMVSKAAEVAPPPHTEPVSVVQVVPTAAAAAAATTSATPANAAPTPSEQAPGYSVPAEIAAARQPDITHWIMLGSAAAFLFIVWIAIYFGFRW